MIALLWALGNSGEVKALPIGEDDSILSIGEALMDGQATFYSPEKELAFRLERTGACWTPPYRARYHFYPTLLADDLAGLELAPSGGSTETDASATIILGCAFGSAIEREPVSVTRLRLRDPRLHRSSGLAVAGLPPEFWSVRERSVCYPVGWDVLLVSGDQVVGISRNVLAEAQ
jgi:alpha-D-ribose 1-methylphosphonate 5-triphosphate synthase subunit PhnH